MRWWLVVGSMLAGAACTPSSEGERGRGEVPSSRAAPTGADRAPPVADDRIPGDRWSALPAPIRPEHRVLAEAVRKGLPAGSGDYADALAAVMLMRRGTIAPDQLREALVAAAYPPHRAGDAYLVAPVPSPPPGAPFDPASMPTDWEGTWGEVAMAFLLGELTREEYASLHHAAHPSCARP